MKALFLDLLLLRSFKNFYSFIKAQEIQAYSMAQAYF